jgi:hypothetical protein
MEPVLTKSLKTMPTTPGNCEQFPWIALSFANYGLRAVNATGRA